MFEVFHKGIAKVRSGKGRFGTQRHPFQACLERSAESLDFSAVWGSIFGRFLSIFICSFYVCFE